MGSGEFESRKKLLVLELLRSSAVTNLSRCQVIRDTAAFFLDLDNSLHEFRTWIFPESLQRLYSLSSAVLANALKNGHEGFVKLLLATGKFDVNSKDNNVQTPLFWAAHNGERVS
jgi:ankyrin repeat protein